MNMERTRTNLHLKESEELGEMLRQDPKIENNYLKRVIKAKDIQISNLQNEKLVLSRRIQDLIDLAVMNVEAGLTIQSALEKMKILAMKEGILDDTKFHAAR
ncbi:glucose-1-phosphatase [Clostridium botulinum]|uniref:glucose-1-phosphatase n=1 Tax=Clostridium botulinum TaxID=1491 RepID=UPI0019689AE7|nr:glucose-1-phosphatase [Clostridium botulinum]MBN1058489.1 glucose-1-phosphatase [Clostridium botulinum]